jgi:uncharacterized protein
MQVNCNVISQLALKNEEENDQFVQFLKTQDSLTIDKYVEQLNAAIAPKIDCTECGNCCKNLMINVEPDELAPLADYLKITQQQLKTKYIEEGSNGMMLINTIPCHFLAENKCTVYEHRFFGCRQFPNLEAPQFTKRLFTTMMHYGKCPIIFNVVEALKKATHFC